jgi:GNAT superfamily N-acetyltransferase
LIASVEIADPQTIRIRTKGPAPGLLSDLEQISIIARHAAEGRSTADFNAGKAAIGTGPYTYVSWQPGDRLRLAANPDYWGGVEPWTNLTIRPIPNDGARVAAMLAGANLVVTARDASGRLAGVARSLTDFAYACYLSDLCVDPAFQVKGIGRALIAETKRILGPGCMLLLLSAPDPMTWYPKLGLEPVANGFIIRRDG